MTAQRPSKKQRELLSYIEAFIKTNGYGPSYREIMHALHYKSVSTVAIHVDNLIKKGQLRKRDHSARSLEVATATIPEFKAATPVTQAQGKWLVDKITARFDAAEASQNADKVEIDNLYVLVGALHVLGMADAARVFKRRLINLTS